MFFTCTSTAFLLCNEGTFLGLLASLLGGMAIGLAYLAALLLACNPADLAIAPPQWRLILVAGIGGLLGSLIDSLLGKDSI
jgi:uncharacterized membrane protein